MGFIEPHEGQKRFLTEKPECRFRLALAGVQGGKTEAGCMYFASKLLNSKNGYFVLAAPTHNMVVGVTLEKLMEVIKSMAPNVKWFTHMDLKLLKQCKDINGNTVYLRSTSDPNLLRGPTLDGIFFDEAGMEDSPEPFRIFRQRIAVKRGFMILTTTPKGPNWLKRDFIDLYEGGDERFHMVKWPSIANPAFPKEEYEHAKATMPADWFNQEYNAEILNFGGLVFPNFDYAKFVGDYPYNPDLPVYWGVDFGIANPFYCGFWQFDENYGEIGRYIQIDEMQVSGYNTLDAIELCLAKGYPKPAWVSCDPSGRYREQATGANSIAMFGEYFDIAVRYEKDWNVNYVKAQGIRDMHQLISLGLIYHDHKCRHMIEAYKNYHYKMAREGMQGDDIPVKDDSSHPMDSAQYFILGRPRTENTWDKDKEREIHMRIMGNLDPNTGLPLTY